MKRLLTAALTTVLAAMLPLGAEAQQKLIDMIIALPSPTLTFSAAFLAEDAGLYTDKFLK